MRCRVILLASAFYKFSVVFSENVRTKRGFVGLDSRKYVLNRSIYELTLVRLLHLPAFGPYGDEAADISDVLSP